MVEVMGHKSGYLAVNTGIATGAFSILIPELEVNVGEIITKMKFVRKMGKKHFIIIVAEGAADSYKLAAEIEEKTGIESRATILGHVQRGGSPTERDRVSATRFGYEAVQLLAKGMGDRIMAFRQRDLVSYPMEEAMAMKKSLDLSLLDLNNTLSV